MTSREEPGTVISLLCRVRDRLCSLPLQYVVETMRPLPIEAVAGAPDVVRGLAIIRGAPVPVIDVARLLGAATAFPTRFVTMKVGDRRVALAVDAVLGVRGLPIESLQELPPLLGGVAAEIVAVIGRLDAELLLVLRGAQLVPDDVAAGCEASPTCP